MKIRMLGNNCNCWKKGDVFEVLRDNENFLYIECHDEVNGGEHYLTDESCTDISDISKFADIHEVVS